MALKQAANSILKRATDAGDVPGVIALATDRDGSIYEGAFGLRALGQSAPMTMDTVVWIASMTKAVTGLAAMQLVERGKLDLDGPAGKVVPALGAVQVLEGFDGAGQPRLRAPKRPVTLRHLLTHTAGFSYEIWSEAIGRYQQARNVPGIISCENAALTTPLLFDPGERWEYGINMDWAGKMVEAASGMTLGAYMKENIFAPLGMSETAFKMTPAMRARLAKIHQRGEDGKLAATDLEIPQAPQFEMGGGGLYSTAGDYAKFVRLMLNGGTAEGRAIVTPATFEAMTKNAMGANVVTKLKTAAPPLSHDAEFFPGMIKKWGLSFQITTERAPTGRSPGSLSWAGLANTFFWIDLARGVGGVFLSQVLPFADTRSLPLFLAFESEVYRSL